MSEETPEDSQKEVCARYGVPWTPSPPHLKVGVAREVNSKLEPVNGLRHAPEGDTTGWYIWAGQDFSTKPDFFVPLHVEHLAEWRPEVVRFLGLPPGWRFLVAKNFEDVWEDVALLDVRK